MKKRVMLNITHIRVCIGKIYCKYMGFHPSKEYVYKNISSLLLEIHSYYKSKHTYCFNIVSYLKSYIVKHTYKFFGLLEPEKVPCLSGHPARKVF